MKDMFDFSRVTSCRNDTNKHKVEKRKIKCTNRRNKK